MSSGNTVFKGVVRGRVIELDRESGMPDGQAVSVTLRPDAADPPDLRLADWLAP